MRDTGRPSFSERGWSFTPKDTETILPETVPAIYVKFRDSEKGCFVHLWMMDLCAKGRLPKGSDLAYAAIYDETLRTGSCQSPRKAVHDAGVPDERIEDVMERFLSSGALVIRDGTYTIPEELMMLSFGVFDVRKSSPEDLRRGQRKAVYRTSSRNWKPARKHYPTKKITFSYERHRNTHKDTENATGYGQYSHSVSSL